MDRADVIIFGGGLVGLALASALDSSGLSAIVVDPADPSRAATPRSTAAPARSRRARCACSRRSASPIICAEPGCPIRRIAVADGLEPGGLHFDADDDEPLGWMHENRHLRAALHARAEAGKNLWLLWKSRVTERRPRRPWRGRRARRRPQAPRAAAGRRRRPQFGDPRGRRDQDRALEIRSSGDRLGAPPRARRTTMSPMRFSIRRARSRCCQ